MTLKKQKPEEPIDHEAVAAEIARIRSLSKDDLRVEWRKLFKKVVPKALTKDLLARMIIWEMQARLFGGFDKATLRLLDSYAKGNRVTIDRLRLLKPGAQIVREYQGKRYTVTVVRDGFEWEGQVFQSLSVIAKEITGTNWNGPRFFGLREADKHSKSGPQSNQCHVRSKVDAGASA